MIADVILGRGVVHTLNAHSALTPECRRGPFTDGILSRCEEITRNVCAGFGADPCSNAGRSERAKRSPRA